MLVKEQNETSMFAKSLILTPLKEIEAANLSNSRLSQIDIDAGVER
jgi:hypothetical protein